ANVQDVTGRLKGPQGGLGVLMGNEADARQVMVTLERANALLARVDALAARVDSLVANADKQVFGQGAPEGQGALVPDLRAAVQQVTGLLGEARGTLRQVDALLVEAQGIAANTRTATTDLDVLRAQVGTSLRKVDSLVNDINRRWPFARETEIELK
ncbi:MAG: mammalian cell entry protein, partial [Hydrogenophaga sp.]|nr:mammalian cell entry protein [Hydrogenophaga sp.]